MSNPNYIENMKKIGKALSVDSLMADPRALPNAMRDLWIDDEYIDLFQAFTSSSAARTILECIKNTHGTRSEYERQKQLLMQKTYLRENAAVTVLEGLWAMVGKSVPTACGDSSPTQQQQNQYTETHRNHKQQYQRTEAETYREEESYREQCNEFTSYDTNDSGIIYKQKGPFEKLAIDTQSPWYLASIPSIKPSITMKESLIGCLVSFLLYLAFDMINISLSPSIQDSVVGVALSYLSVIASLFMFFYLCYAIHLPFRKAPTSNGAYEKFTAKPLKNGMVACNWKAEPHARYGLAVNDKWIAIDVSSPCKLELIDSNQPTIILTKNCNRKIILVDFITIDMR